MRTLAPLIIIALLLHNAMRRADETAALEAIADDLGRRWTQADADRQAAEQALAECRGETETEESEHD